MRRIVVRLAVLMVVALSVATLAGCAPAGPPASAAASPNGAGASSSPAGPSAAASPDRVAGWRDDLARLVPGMDRIHPDLDHGTPIATLEAAVAELSAKVPTSTDDELLVGVLRIVALVSAEGHDGHTGAFIWGSGTYPVDSLPFRLWLFDDDLVIVDALPPHEALIGSRIDTLEGRPIADVLTALDPAIPRDNDQTVRLLTPRYLLIPQVLRGLDLADAGPVTLGLTSDAGETSTLDVEPVPMAEYNDWAGPYGLHLPADPDLRYLSRIDEDLWWERLPDGETLYVQYNRVENLRPGELAELTDAVKAPDLARVILDIRHNFGGEVPALDPMVTLFDDPAVDVPGRLFVITGRNTWSAGSLLLARLEDRTSATLAGEPMAGNPTFYGDIVPLELPYSGLEVSVTEMLEVGVAADDARLNIDLDAAAVLTQEEWAAGRDPALDLILGVAP